jgi:hypothetical protein
MVLVKSMADIDAEIRNSLFGIRENNNPQRGSSRLFHFPQGQEPLRGKKLLKRNWRLRMVQKKSIFLFSLLFKTRFPLQESLSLLTFSFAE